MAFARTGGLAVVVPRLVIGLAGGWADTAVAIPDGNWTDVLTGAWVRGGEVGLADLLCRFPVAVLASETMTAADAGAGDAGDAGAGTPGTPEPGTPEPGTPRTPAAR